MPLVQNDSTRVCDFALSRGTCNAPMCDDHATPNGHNRDYCPMHNMQGKLDFGA